MRWSHLLRVHVVKWWSPPVPLDLGSTPLVHRSANQSHGLRRSAGQHPNPKRRIRLYRKSLSWLLVHHCFPFLAQHRVLMLSTRQSKLSSCNGVCPPKSSTFLASLTDRLVSQLLL
ncbi:hypothetical protein GQ53DRAFT_337170 [Thozetella sp. PMI_491]|nr:hypothetical protein GQ53DRAFT_337170 [Thozetella sp. PMI_491]